MVPDPVGPNNKMLVLSICTAGTNFPEAVSTGAGERRFFSTSSLICSSFSRCNISLVVEISMIILRAYLFWTYAGTAKFLSTDKMVCVGGCVWESR